VGLRPHSDDDCIQEVARVEEEDGDGGWVALWRPSRTPRKRGRLPQSAEWGAAGVGCGNHKTKPNLQWAFLYVGCLIRRREGWGGRESLETKL